ncbi:hypothetical protein V1260_08060 [Brachybacterium sp. J144]|uniref:hypothetical protein n=1 Tax=Brachybacterium sp. J144 TaxID=3116487 RepID=UPI002E76AF02|nr:hypothetical protein [Brachybacterium sp. J144]MEE1650746.1 hypothetical protein [Brachybacterium sp. J144]
MDHDTSDGVRVLLVSDPGLPTRRAQSLRDDLQKYLAEEFRPPVEVHTRTAMLRLRPDDSLDLDDAVQIAREFGHPDVVLLLTELPRLTDGRPLIAEIFPEENVAVISCPTLGAFATRRRILDTLMDCILRMTHPAGPRGPSRFGRSWRHWNDADDAGAHSTLHAGMALGGVRMVLGMVASNEPLKTAPRLSSALAAASATGAFGIFYSSIWAMSTFLSTPRLLSIGALGIGAMILWLILSNVLWDSPKRSSLARVVLLYNLSTVMTLLVCVAALYLALVLVILIGGLIVISPEYMTEIIGEEPTFATYLDIAWLSAAMGVVAGALGSSFDRETNLRSLTHGQRERQRRYTEESAPGSTHQPS